jgi:hypothetical protein
LVLARRSSDKGSLILSTSQVCVSNLSRQGTAETEMIAFAEKTEIHNGLWSTFIVKPSMVLRKQNSILPWFSCCAMGFVRVDELAAAMIDIARNGSEEQVAQNPEIVMRGRSVLDTPKFGSKWCPLR